MNRWDVLGLNSPVVMAPFVVKEKKLVYTEVPIPGSEGFEVVWEEEDDDDDGSGTPPEALNKTSDCVAKTNAQLKSDLNRANVNYRFERAAILDDAMFVAEMEGYGERIKSGWKLAGASVISLGAAGIAQAGATAFGASRVASAANTLQNTINAANAGRYGIYGADAISLAASGLSAARTGQASLNLIASVGGGALNATTQAIVLGGSPWTPANGLMDLGDAFLGGPVLDTMSNVMAAAAIPRAADLALSDRGGMLSALKGNSDLYGARVDAAYQKHFNAILNCYK